MSKSRKKLKSTKDQEPAIEVAMAELQQIVADLESGQEPLDDSLQKFEHGMTLLRLCHKNLEAAAQRIELVTGVGDDGSFETSPFSNVSTAAKKGNGDKTAGGPEDRTDSLF